MRVLSSKRCQNCEAEGIHCSVHFVFVVHLHHTKSRNLVHKKRSRNLVQLKKKVQFGSYGQKVNGTAKKWLIRVIKYRLRHVSICTRNFY